MEQLPDYVRVSLGGNQFDLDEVIASLAAIAKHCHQVGADKVLIEDRFEFDWGMHDMEKIAAKLPQIGFSDIKIAIYIETGNKQFVSHFGETVANARGIDVGIHLDIESAVTWLGEESS